MDFLALRDSFSLLSFFFLASFLVGVLSSGKLKKGLISFLTATNAVEASLTSAAVHFCLTRRKTAMMWVKYSSLLPEL
jgi:hypothetical protein